MKFLSALKKIKCPCPSWIKNRKFWKIFGISVLGIFVLGSIVFIVFEFTVAGRLNPISKAKATDVAVKYVNENLISSGEAKVKNIKKIGPLYLLTLDVNGNEYESYITIDGRYFFPYGFDLKESDLSSKEASSQDIEKRDVPEIHLYTMSYCPYGNQAEEVIYPVVKLLGDKVKIEPHFVIYSDYNGGGPNYCLDKENKYCSMHGIEELNEDIRELCIYKYQPDKYWDYVVGTNAKCDVSNIATCWSGVAKEKGIDVAKITTCQKNEAIALLENEVSLNDKYGITGSPDLMINGASYSGNRTPEGYKAGICSGFTTQPSECSTALDNASSASANGGCE